MRRRPNMKMLVAEDDAVTRKILAVTLERPAFFAL
jgi:hypothetical protein